MPFRRSWLGRVVAVAATLAVGCTSAAGPSASSPPPSASPARPTVPASPVASAPAASTSPAPSYVAGPTAWRIASLGPNVEDAQFQGVIAIDGGFVAFGCRVASTGEYAGTCATPAAWTSPDAEAWGPPIDLPMAPGETLGIASSAAAGPSGLVIGGQTTRDDGPHAAIWFTPDLETYERVRDDPQATIISVASFEAGFVAVGATALTHASGFRAWWSDDGSSWEAATVPPADDGYPVAVRTDAAGELLAFGPTCSVCVAQTRWWSSADGLAWTSEGVAPEIENALVRAVAPTDDGWQAAGWIDVAGDPIEPGHWVRSGAGGPWTSAAAPVLPAGASVTHLLRVGPGTVAGASDSGEPPVALIVASGPDGRWRDLVELPDLSLVGLVRDPAEPRRIIVVGASIDASGGTGPPVIWIGEVDWAP